MADVWVILQIPSMFPHAVLSVLRFLNQEIKQQIDLMRKESCFFCLKRSSLKFSLPYSDKVIRVCSVCEACNFVSKAEGNDLLLKPDKDGFVRKMSAVNTCFRDVSYMRREMFGSTIFGTQPRQYYKKHILVHCV